MGDFVRVARAQEIPPGIGKTVVVGGTLVAVFYVDGTYHAIQNTCRHRGGPLGEGELSGSVVTCPWHGWQYEVTTGGNVADPEIRVDRRDPREHGGAFTAGDLRAKHSGVPRAP